MKKYINIIVILFLAITAAAQSRGPEKLEFALNSARLDSVNAHGIELRELTITAIVEDIKSISRIFIRVEDELTEERVLLVMLNESEAAGKSKNSGLHGFTKSEKVIMLSVGELPPGDYSVYIAIQKDRKTRWEDVQRITIE